MRHAFALLALALCAVTPACASTAARCAQSAYDRGDYTGAARLADAGLAKEPGDGDLWRVRIRADLARGDARSAVAAYKRWRGGRGDDADTLRGIAFDTLEQALASPARQVQVQAIQIVEDLMIEDLSQPVAEQMADEDDVVAAAAAVAVLRAYPQAPQVATDMLASEDADARAIAVAGIARKVGLRAVDDLRHAAADPDPRVRRAAVAGLAGAGDPATLDLLRTLAQRDPAGDVRASAILALARTKQAAFAPIASAALADPYLGARLAAVELYAAIGDRAAVDRLLTGADVAVAIRAARAARDRNPTGAAAAIDRGLADAEWTVRAGAVNVLRSVVDDAGALARARRAVADAELEVRLAAARVLAAAGQRAEAAAVFTAALAAALAPTDPTRVQAAIDLARLDDARGVAALSELAERGATPELRRMAAGGHALAHTITPGLVAALGDDSPAVRLEAARAVWILTKE